MQQKLIRIIGGEAGLILAVLGVFFGINLMPSKIARENRSPGRTVFVNLAEQGMFTSYYTTDYENMNRIDVLFKNPNLESRDELSVSVTDDNGSALARKSLTGFNLGDTTQARVDLDRPIKNRGERFGVEIKMTRLVDGKLSFGVKDNSIEIIKYYKSGLSMRSALNNTSEFVKKTIRWQPIVWLLPMACLGVLLW